MGSIFSGDCHSSLGLDISLEMLFNHDWEVNWLDIHVYDRSTGLFDCVPCIYPRSVPVVYIYFYTRVYDAK